MKKILKFIFVMTLFLSFNLCLVHAAELDDGNNDNTPEVEDNEIEEAGDLQDDEKDEEEPGSGETTLTVEPTNENVSNVDDTTGNSLTNDGEVNTQNQNGDTNQNENNSDEEYDYQKVKVFISKVDVEGNPLAGAKLQLKDSTGQVIAEWTSTEQDYIIFLEDGTYTLHEAAAPNGYEVAEDKEFTVRLLHDLESGVDFTDFPCPDYGGTPMYYVEIEGEKQEVYCINQGWETPDDGSSYDGDIITPENIRDFTMQTTPVDIDSRDIKDGIMSDGPIDVSDQSLDDQELYDKILNIIYHRQIAQSVLAERGLYYSVEEIRYITEVALKNYTNPGLAEVQFNKRVTQELLDELDAAGVVYKRYTNNSNRAENPNGAYLSYLKHNYRDFVYNPNAPLGSDIVLTSYGNGNSFGQMVAGHFNYHTRYLTDDEGNYILDGNGNKISVVSHNAKNNQEERDQVARYYELYLFLISDESSYPDDMNLYIYSSESMPSSTSSNDHDGKYQNLLGVTGYYELSTQQTLEVVMEDDYSEYRDVTVEKVWDDKENYSNARPKNVTIELYADDVLYDTVTLNDVVGWSYTWEKLDVLSEDGSKINYTVKEQSVDGYSVEITGDMNTVFIVTNSYYGTGGDDPENPKTADPIVYYVIMIVLSLIGMTSCIYSYKKI